MEQEDYKLWTGETVTYSDEDWGRIVAVASSRLASFLCLDSLPTPMPDDLAMVLANFIYGVLSFQGAKDAQVEEKRIRNFTIRFSSNNAANAFSQVASNYGDVIEKYSNCGNGFAVEKSTRCCCGRF